MRPLFYITGGTLPADALCYVERQADRDLLDALLDAQFCYVLDTRQVGKSSLIERTARNLRERGVVVAKIDLTTTGKEVTAAQWYNGMLRQVADSLHAAGLPDCWDDLRGFWRDNAELGPMQRWVEALRSVVLAHNDANLVIFVDEIESVRSFDFTDEFFAGIRACYNRRVDEPALRRLSFCLAGSATPDELIHSVTSTPFNIGHAITLSDFTRSEAAVLAEGLADKSLLDRILYWTNGHPYLTQRLCAELTETISDNPKSSFVSPDTRHPIPDTHTIDALCERLFFAPEARKSEKNLAFVAKRILDSPLDRAGLLDLYGKVRRGNVVNDEKDALQSTLRLSGIARARNGQLEVRNRIYERVFDPAWIRENMPYAESRRQQTAYRRGLYRAGAMASVVVGIMGLLTLWAVRSQQQANHYRVKAETAAATARLQREEAERVAYIANMNLIPTAYEANQLDHIGELLEETHQENYRLYRGFEWGYWNRLSHLDLLTLKGLTGGIAIFFPDGRRIITGGETTKMWDAQTGRELMAFKGHTEYIHAVAIFPDSQRIVTGSDDNTAKVWDVQTGRERLTLKGHAGKVCSVACSSDCERIVTGSKDNTAKVWDARTGRKILTLKGHTSGVNSVAFSSDCQQIVTGSFDSTAKVWDARTGRERLTLQGFNGSVLSVAISPDARQIVVASLNASSDKKIKVWDARTGLEILTLTGHAEEINSVAFSPDSRRIVTGSEDNTAKVWDARTGLEILTLKGHTSGVNSVAFSPDGARIITGSRDNTAKVWDAWTQRKTMALNENVEANSVAFSSDGRRIITGGETTKVWDVQTGRELMALTGHAEQVNSVAFSPDDQRIVTGSADKTAKVWDAQTGRKLRVFKGHKNYISDVVFSPDGQQIVTGSYDNTAKVWDVQTGRERLTLKGHTDHIRSVAISSDGQRIVTGSQDSTAKVWDARTGLEILTLTGHTERINSVAFSPDSRWIVTGSDDKTAKVWDAQKGQEVLTLKGHTAGIHAVAFSPDSQRIVTGSNDLVYNGEVKLWDTQTGREVLELKSISTEVDGWGVWSVAFSSDGKRIVTGGKNVNVWFSDPNDCKFPSRAVDIVNAHLALAQKLISAKKYEEAVIEFKEVLRLRPALGSAAFFGNLGWYEYLAGHTNDAIKSNRNALEKTPTLTLARLNLGLIYATQNDWPKAKQEYDLALKTLLGYNLKLNLKAGIDDVQTAIKKRDNPALEKALVYLQKAGGK